MLTLENCFSAVVSTNVGDGADPSRIASQIVHGMGFLGSATVFNSDNYVKGINTAANLWISAAVGMAIGLDLWEYAAVLSILVSGILIVSNMYKKKMYQKRRDKKEK